ncbi:MAG TPA: Ku protein [Bryobacteraceae bacterium]|nr:Ku protein [Bryobacteraceae bacterium]
MPSTVWKGHLTFGLLSIPIRIVRAARQEKVRFQRVYRKHARAAEEADDAAEPEPGERPAIPTAEPLSEVAPVRSEFVTRTGGEKIEPVEILKGVEYEKGQFAVFRPEEVRRFRVETSREMEIIQFVKLEEIDPVYFNASYYVLPDRGGEKPYALFFEAMRKTKHAALTHVAMHGRDQFALLRAGGAGILLHTMYFQNEAHPEDAYRAERSDVKPAEMKLAEMLIAQLAAPFDPAVLKDERLERMRAAIL